MGVWLLMRQWRGLTDQPDELGPCAVTIGRFDGIHRGHQRVFSRIRQETSGLGLPVVLVTFGPHPGEVIRPGSHPLLLCSPRHNSQLLAEQGVDAVWTIPFTQEFSRLGAGEFVRSVLVNRLHAAQVVVGANFRFGRNAAGDLALLEKLGDTYGYKAVGVPLVANAGKPISSTGIRAKLAAGDVHGAAHDLGRPHRLQGTAVRGYQHSQMPDLPRANVETLPYTAIPAAGVYAGWLADTGSQGGGQDDRRRAVISIGTGPAAGKPGPAVEAYVLDDDLDVSGEQLAVDFIARLRAPMRFTSIEEQATQTRKDAADARWLLIA